jgi:tetratricopeptide (TPR) repeat protein
MNVVAHVVRTLILVAGLAVGVLGCGGSTGGDTGNHASGGDASSLLVQAREALAEKDYARALDRAEAKLSRDSTSLEALVVKAEALAALDRLGDAQSAADRAVALEPRYVDARLARARVAVARGSLAAAAKDLTVAASIDSRTPSVLRRQIRVQAALQRYDRAQETVRRLLRVRPDDAEGLALDAALRQADRGGDAGRTALRALEADRTASCNAWTAVTDSIPGRSPFQRAAATLHARHCS